MALLGSLSRRVARLLSPPPPPPAVPLDVATRADLDAIAGELKTINQTLTRLARRESQVRAVLTRDAEMDRLLGKLRTVVNQPGTEAHVAKRIRKTELHLSPFPYAVVDRLLPRDLYNCLIKGLPPLELFADKPVNKQQLVVPFDLAPTYSQRVWRHLAKVVVPNVIVPAVLEKFREPIADWIRLNWPDIDPQSVDFHSSDGRILLRRRGYHIPPHRDPKWGFITCILYLARPDDSEAWGTQLFAVENDVEARGAPPHWIDAVQCTKVTEVAFKPNRMLVFLNSVGGHGAEIPADAEPATLERYIYQFRIAPTAPSMGMLKAALPEERREIWSGKNVEY